MSSILVEDKVEDIGNRIIEYTRTCYAIVSQRPTHEFRDTILLLVLWTKDTCTIEHRKS
jgi:hypothetical protein